MFRFLRSLFNESDSTPSTPATELRTRLGLTGLENRELLATGLLAAVKTPVFTVAQVKTLSPVTAVKAASILQPVATGLPVKQTAPVGTLTSKAPASGVLTTQAQRDTPKGPSDPADLIADARNPSQAGGLQTVLWGTSQAAKVQAEVTAALNLQGTGAGRYGTPSGSGGVTTFADVLKSNRDANAPLVLHGTGVLPNSWGDISGNGSFGSGDRSGLTGAAVDLTRIFGNVGLGSAPPRVGQASYERGVDQSFNLGEALGHIGSIAGGSAAVGAVVWGFKGLFFGPAGFVAGASAGGAVGGVVGAVGAALDIVRVEAKKPTTEPIKVEGATTDQSTKERPAEGRDRPALDAAGVGLVAAKINTITGGLKQPGADGAGRIVDTSKLVSGTVVLANRTVNPVRDGGVGGSAGGAIGGAGNILGGDPPPDGSNGDSKTAPHGPKPVVGIGGLGGLTGGRGPGGGR